MRTVRIDYAAVNARGVSVRTFQDRDIGKTWVRENAYLHDGLQLEVHETTARRVYKPRLAPRHSFAIPPMPVAAVVGAG